MQNVDMNAEQISELICRLVSEVPGCFLRYDQIQPEHHLQEDLGLDSLAMVDLMVAIEDNLNIYFDPVQLDLETAFKTVRSLSNLVIELTI
jgi:acyl carrier protein